MVPDKLKWAVKFAQVWSNLQLPQQDTSCSSDSLPIFHLLNALINLTRDDYHFYFKWISSISLRTCSNYIFLFPLFYVKPRGTLRKNAIRLSEKWGRLWLVDVRCPIISLKSIMFVKIGLYLVIWNYLQ